MQLTQFCSISLIIFLFGGCVSTQKISKKTINHSYYNIKFTPEQIQKNGLGKVEITVVPIDAARINQETFEAASRDGNYEKELAVAIEKRKSESSGLSKREKAYINGVINAIDAVSKLEKDNQIPANTAYQLKMRILYGEAYGKNGTEVTSLSDVETYPDNFNPYKINEKYLSVFKVTFENKGNEIQKVALKEFQIVSGEELLYPLGIEYFENNLKEEPEKTKNAYRMNMPEEIVITPSQRITKFIAVPAINTRNENLQIQLIKGKDIVNFDFKVTEQALSKNYNVESFDIFTSGLNDPFAYYLYYAVSYQNGVSYAATNERVFVNNEKLSSTASVFIVAINKTNSKAQIAQKVNFRFGDEEKNKVTLSFEKKK